MKLQYKLLFLIAVSVLAMACSRKEDELIAREDSSQAKFTFPENTPNDVITQAIYDEFGVQIIYKAVTSKDLNYSWSGPEDKRFTILTEERAKRDIEFVNKHIFRKISNVELVKRVFRPYLYLVYDCNMAGAILGSYVPLKYDFTGVDSWSFCFEGRGAEFYPGYSAILFPVKEEDVKLQRGIIFHTIFTLLIERKLVDVPSQFKTDFDYGTPIVTASSMVANENFFMKRGFLGMVSPGTFHFSVGSYTIAKENPKRTFLNYMIFVAKYSKEELIDKSIALSGGKYKDFEKVMKYYDFVDNYLMENYDLNLKLLHTL